MRLTIMERAIELAKSGMYSRIGTIVRQLHHEGYAGGYEHLSGLQTRKKILDLCREAGALPPTLPRKNKPHVQPSPE